MLHPKLNLIFTLIVTRVSNLQIVKELSFIKKNILFNIYMLFKRKEFHFMFPV